jgi:hypothetical protein
MNIPSRNSPKIRLPEKVIGKTLSNPPTIGATYLVI